MAPLVKSLAVLTALGLSITSGVTSAQSPRSVPGAVTVSNLAGWSPAASDPVAYTCVVCDPIVGVTIEVLLLSKFAQTPPPGAATLDSSAFAAEIASNISARREFVDPVIANRRAAAPGFETDMRYVGSAKIGGLTFVEMEMTSRRAAEIVNATEYFTMHRGRMVHIMVVRRVAKLSPESAREVARFLAQVRFERW
ncbi:MAG TPA: hypothetical protein VJ890_29320 [Vineibacter sp.]|nr:hypothetical protein [Vineibacter sp.]